MKGRTIPAPIVGEWARRWYGGVQTSFQKNPDASRGVVPEEELRQSRRSYAAAISHVDEQIGRILAALEKSGELENTLILFTSDHGDIMGDHYLYRKTFPVEGSVHVPMLLRWPARLGLEARRGQIRSELVELRDVLPTFLDAAGLSRPPAVEGASLLEILRGHPGRDILDLEHASCYAPKDGWVALMDQRYKYVYYTCTGEQQLFDLEKDSQERQDLAADPASAALLKIWRAKMAKHLAIRGDGWVRNGDLVVQAKSQLRRANNPNVLP
jgi:arylsulfatase A-like enzyme